MSNPADIKPELRDIILNRPDMILDDQDMMKALLAANEKAMGNNIIDLRGIAMDRLESRLDRLEDTHRSVIAAAYENLAGTNQVHRAILRMMDALDFETFLSDLEGDVAEILRVQSIRIVLETRQVDMPAAQALEHLNDVICLVIPGFSETYMTAGRNSISRTAVLRGVSKGFEQIFGSDSAFVRSEACLKLDLGKGKLPAMLVFGSEDPNRFSAQHGTELLEFFAGVFERVMRRWLA